MSKTKNTTAKGGGILSGLLLLVVGIGVLWYNEGRTVKTQSTINEAKKVYKDVSSEEINDKYDGNLVKRLSEIYNKDTSSFHEGDDFAYIDTGLHYIGGKKLFAYLTC